MPFCPQCKAEYTQGISICADCQVELIPERPLEDTVEYADWESVQRVHNEVVGNMIKGVLEGAGIDVVLRSHVIIAHGGISAKSYWGDILVHSDHLEKAKEIIDEYLASLPTNVIRNREPDLEAI